MQGNESYDGARHELIYILETKCCPRYAHLRRQMEPSVRSSEMSSEKVGEVSPTLSLHLLRLFQVEMLRNTLGS